MKEYQTRVELEALRGDAFIPLLDHGHVRLVDWMGSDLSVVRSARISYNAAWRAGENEKNDANLINYLMRNRHTTPFESVTLTFDIKAPIFVFRQWHRHRTQSYNEMSARYTELPEEFYIPEPMKIGKQDAKNKQARSLDMTPEEGKSRDDEIRQYKLQCEVSFALYKQLLDKGWPRELARMVLPVSAYSQMFTTVNLWNLFHFITLRSDSHAQYEIRVYSDAILQLLKLVVPACVDAYLEYV